LSYTTRLAGSDTDQRHAPAAALAFSSIWMACSPAPTDLRPPSEVAAWGCRISLVIAQEPRRASGHRGSDQRTSFGFTLAALVLGGRIENLSITRTARRGAGEMVQPLKYPRSRSNPFYTSGQLSPFHFLNESSHPARVCVRNVEHEPKIPEQPVVQFGVRHLRPDLLPAAVIDHVTSFLHA